MRATVLALVLALAFVAGAPLALAQTKINPIEGEYHEEYIVAGRVLDVNGRPFAGGHVVVELVQGGVKAAPVRATVNCKGDFITTFNLLEPSYEGAAKVTAYDGETAVGSTNGGLEPFWRRTDVTMKLASAWNGTCTGNQDVFDVSASVVVRMLNRTEPYSVGSSSFDAKPYQAWLRLRYEPPGSPTICPPKPSAPGACEQFFPDPRGDLRYTFTLDRPVEGGGRVFVLLENHTADECDPSTGTCFEVPIDPSTRLGVRYVEMTGRGLPERKDAPALAPALALAIVGLAALASRSLLGQRRG